MLFLGAGASKPFGLPTMKQYVNGFRRFIVSRDPSLEQAYDELVEILGFFPDGDDLEALYTMLQELQYPTRTLLNPASVYLLSNFGTQDIEEVFQIFAKSHYGRLAPLVALLEEYILKSCTIRDQDVLVETFSALYEVISKTWWFKSNGGKSGVSFYQDSVRAGTGLRTFFPAFPTVTTNYDLAVEIYLAQRKVEFEDGFRRGAGGVLSFDPSTLRRLTPGSVSLLKLHGSIDWKRTDDGRIIKSLDRPGSKTVTLEKISGEAMVFPTSDKADLKWPFLDLTSAFLDVLRGTRLWLVIGYSFRDQILRRMFLENLTEQTRLILLSPRASTLVGELSEEIPSNLPSEVIAPVDAKFGTSEAMNQLAGLLEDGL